MSDVLLDVEKLSLKSGLPAFAPGDTVIVSVSVVILPNTAVIPPLTPTSAPAPDTSWMIAVTGVAALATFVLTIGLVRRRR